MIKSDTLETVSQRRDYYGLLKRADQAKALEDCLSDTGPIFGKRVLEIGSDWDGIMLRIMKDKLGALDCIGVNPEIETPVIQEGYRLLALDGSDTGLPDNAIDLVFSHATLEHVSRIEKILAEVGRVLRVGGKAWLSFGPIWSSQKGHHLWLKSDTGKYTFTENNPIPDYSHLLWSESDLTIHLSKMALAPELIEKICYEVFRSPGINRLFLEDYLKYFRSSRLKVRQIKRHRDTRLNIWKRTLRYFPRSVRLMIRYPFRDLTTYGATVVLEKVP